MLGDNRAVSAFDRRLPFDVACSDMGTRSVIAGGCGGGGEIETSDMAVAVEEALETDEAKRVLDLVSKRTRGGHAGYRLGIL